MGLSILSHHLSYAAAVVQQPYTLPCRAVTAWQPQNGETDAIFQFVHNCHPNALNTSIYNARQASLLVKDGALPIVGKAPPFPHCFADQIVIGLFRITNQTNRITITTFIIILIYSIGTKTHTIRVKSIVITAKRT